MQIVTIGLSHKTAPVEEREKLAFSNHDLPSALRALVELPSLQEGAILSTCNRVEIYGVISNSKEGEGRLKHFLCRNVPERVQQMDGKLYTLLDQESVTHLFEVASGIDSMVLGENEILGQVKSAYQEAVQAGTVGKVMHALFQKSLQTAKAVRQKTGIGRGFASVSSVAVHLAKRILGNLRGRKIMVVGAGEMSRLTAKVLQEEGVSSIFVSNRNLEKAKELAEDFNGQVIGFEQFPNWLEEVDIVISSTAAPHFILSKETVAPLMKERKQRPLFLVDIAVPRDIDPAVNELDNVYLYDIDDLQGIVKDTLCNREKQLGICHSLIQQKSERFMSWFGQVRSSK